MASGFDPYAVLGVSRDASDAQIAHARRRLSREYHPDVNPAPDAASRFDEVQRAYHQLSATWRDHGRARDEQAWDEQARDQQARDGQARDQQSSYQQARDWQSHHQQARDGHARDAQSHHQQARGGQARYEQGRTRVMRDPGGGYGTATEASPGIFVQPTLVDFGRLTPARPRADARVTVAWTGAAPARLESTRGSGWWANVGSEQPAKSCVVFYLRAHGHEGTPEGRQHAQFTVIFDGTELAVELTADIQGEFPPGSRPDFTPHPQPFTAGRRYVLPAELQAWLLVLLALVILLLVFTTSAHA